MCGVGWGDVVEILNHQVSMLEQGDRKQCLIRGRWREGMFDWVELIDERTLCPGFMSL